MTGYAEKIDQQLEILWAKEEYNNEESKKAVQAIGELYWQKKYKERGTKRAIADYLANQGAAELFVKMMTSLGNQGLFKDNVTWYAAYYTYNTTWNFSDASTLLCRKLGEAGIVKLLLANAGHEPFRENLKSKNVLYLVKSSISILNNMTKCPENRQYYQEGNAVEVLRPYMTCSDAFVKSVSMMTLAKIIDEEQSELLAEDTGAIDFLINMLRRALEAANRRARGFSVAELCEGLAKLAVNEKNKKKIVEKEALPLLVKVLETGNELEKTEAANTVWTLAFDDDVREKIMAEPELVPSLEKLETSTNESLKSAALGALWVIRKTGEERPKTAAKKSKERQLPHVMISYQWDHQKILVSIKKKLQAAGFKVWMDLEQMGGSTLQAMAEAVENSAVVIIAMSHMYKESPNCRTEAEYTFQLRKDIVPLMMESHYKPDGWLGMILGAKLYIDFSGTQAFDSAMAKLIKELGVRGREDTQTDVVVAQTAVEVGAGAPPPAVMWSSSHPLDREAEFLKWTQEDVAKWLEKHDLGSLKSEFSEYDGKLLRRLQGVRSEAPEFFYTMLTTKMGLKTMPDVLKFTEALDNLTI
ncbi:hypothetical protein Bbelb_189640 [Branchiostoma belcheri]|nr:hypothetical protein Bbelb_189640 [Branchiostoma belcheri]